MAAAAGRRGEHWTVTEVRAEGESKEPVFCAWGCLCIGAKEGGRGKKRRRRRGTHGER